MSPPCVVVGGRPLDEWRDAELKEELERRNLSTAGPKEDLVMRLDDAVRGEQTKESADHVLLYSTSQSESSTRKESILPVVSENESIHMEDKMNLPLGGDSDVIDDVRKVDISSEKEENFVNDGDGKPVDSDSTEAHKDTKLAPPSVKRKPDSKAVGNADEPKRIRLSNAGEAPKSSKPQSGVVLGSTAPSDSSRSSSKHLSRSNYSVNEETLKERVVPPASNPPTNSLRIDGFVRPLVLKAVHELLSGTGTVISFWMNTIKTHCYVSYSSAEEAVDTRNAVYNLKWPKKWGSGSLLVAEFVDPQEVKNHVESSLGLILTPSGNEIRTSSTQYDANMRPQRITQEQVSGLPLPPPLSPRPYRTLGDFFMRTEARPHIYYLPLTDEEVAAKNPPAHE